MVLRVRQSRGVPHQSLVSTTAALTTRVGLAGLATVAVLAVLPAVLPADAGPNGGTVVGGVDARIITGYVPVACQVLRVSHHGSGNAASFQLLQNVNPEVGIISVGPNPPQNAYPEPTLIRRLLLKNVSVYATNRLGTITVSSNGTGYSLTSQKPADDSYWRFINDVAYNGQPYWPK